MKKIAGFAAIIAMTSVLSCQKDQEFKTDSLGVEVTAEENREYSYTDKQAGYWYGRTHQDSPEWWSGWNMAKKRVLADYTLGVGDSTLKRSEAEVTVYPDRLERRWPEATETFYLLDRKPVIYINVETEADSIWCELDMGHIAAVEEAEDGKFFTPWEAQDKRIMLVKEAEGFILTFGTVEECRALTQEFRNSGQQLIAERKARINDLITEYNPLESNIPDLDKAIDWITITMDELITCQQGNGIYAGLPWFNEYWGRDMFISMPGACLVT